MRVLGTDHPHTLISLCNLAFVLWDLGLWSEAESDLRTALEAQTRVLGADHPHTLASRGKLALLSLREEADPSTEPEGRQS
jgi:hypothetical protein